MNYNELKNLTQLKKTSINKVAEQIGMTSLGLRKAIENGSLTIDKLPLLCAALGISISEFFGESKSGYNQQNFKSIVGEGSTYYDNSAALKIIEKQLAEKDLYIKELLSIIKSNK